MPMSDETEDMLAKVWQNGSASRLRNHHRTTVQPLYGSDELSETPQSRLIDGTSFMMRCARPQGNHSGKTKRRSHIFVCIRKRPINETELKQSDLGVLRFISSNHVVLSEPRQRFDLSEYFEHYPFRFDHCFDQDVSTAQIYQHAISPMVSSVFTGSTATCLAYGQTGSGKTYTMMGTVNSSSHGTTNRPSCDDGLFGLTMSDILSRQRQSRSQLETTISVRFFEIYGNKVYDLLNQKRLLQVLEDTRGTVQLVGIREYWVKDVRMALNLIRNGCKWRTNGQTLVNTRSSRSHALLQINIRKTCSTKLAHQTKSQTNFIHQSSSFCTNSNGRTLKHGKFSAVNLHHSPLLVTNSSSYPNAQYAGPLIGRFSLVDLAGNERSADMEHRRSRAKNLESGEINKSLLALKECIRAMNHNAHTYVPFRSSKLTQILRESFVGPKSITCMIATVSPALSCCEHTLNTLRYARCVRNLPPSSTSKIYSGHCKSVVRCRGDSLGSPNSWLVYSNENQWTKANGNPVHPITTSLNRSDDFNPDFQKTITNRNVSRMGGSRSVVDNSESTAVQSEPTSQLITEGHSDIEDEDDTSSLIRDEEAKFEPAADTESHFANEFLRHSAYLQQISSPITVKNIDGRHSGKSMQTTAVPRQHTGGKGCNRQLTVWNKDVVRRHRNLIKNMSKWISSHRKLLQSVPNNEKQSVQGYVNSLMQQLSNEIHQLTEIREAAQILRSMCLLRCN